MLLVTYLQSSPFRALLTVVPPDEVENEPAVYYNPDNVCGSWECESFSFVCREGCSGFKCHIYRKIDLDCNEILKLYISRYTITPLKGLDGNSVTILGGKDASGEPVTDSTLVKFNEERIYQELVDLPMPLTNQMTALIDNDIVVCGGTTQNQLATDECHSYNR